MGNTPVHSFFSVVPYMWESGCREVRRYGYDAIRLERRLQRRRGRRGSKQTGKSHSKYERGIGSRHILRSSLEICQCHSLYGCWPFSFKTDTLFAFTFLTVASSPLFYFVPLLFFSQECGLMGRAKIGDKNWGRRTMGSSENPDQK